MKKRKIVLIGNLKQNPAKLSQVLALASEYKKLNKKYRNIALGMAAPTPFLSELAKKHKKDFAIYAQTVSGEDGGAHTGEASAAQIASIGVGNTIIGHSERRAKGENNEVIQKAVAHALVAKMQVLLCVGEKERHENTGHIRFVNEQIESALSYVKKADAKKLTLAYEPVWAIGENAVRSANENEIYEMAIAIRKKLVEMFGKTAGSLIPILYGGSANAKNCREIMAVHHIDGFLLGRASLDAKELAKIIELTEEK